MQHAAPQYDMGVIIGRFQVHELHKGHRDLIQHVCDRHKKAAIILGAPPIRNSLQNPLDFEARKQMLLEEFPHLIVVYAKDQPLDSIWSKKIDEIVDDLLIGRQTAVIYGGRDSFISHYEGRFPTQELLQAEHYSGRAIRKQIAQSSTTSSADFRAGAIWASTARYPTAFQTVDVAILDGNGNILLGRKPSERLFRFIGGFSEPTSPSLEADARKEVAEEAGVSVEDITYIGSMIVDDWRYRYEADKIKTALFTAVYTHGRPRPGSDIEEVRWFALKSLKPEQLAPVHRPVFAKLKEALNV